MTTVRSCVTGEALDGTATHQLVHASLLDAPQSAVPAFRDRGGVWHYVAADRVNFHRRLGHDVRMVYVEDALLRVTYMADGSQEQKIADVRSIEDAVAAIEKHSGLRAVRCESADSGEAMCWNVGEGPDERLPSGALSDHVCYYVEVDHA